jgi:hypothetical protein
MRKKTQRGNSEKRDRWVGWKGEGTTWENKDPRSKLRGIKRKNLISKSP